MLFVRNELEGREFASREELMCSIKQYYKERGVLLKVGKRSDSRQLYLRCLASESYERRSQHELQRKTSTRLTDCPFGVNAYLQKKRGVWRVNNVSEDHNHELTEGFAENRRLEDQEKNAVRAMARSGSSSSAILSFLRSEFGNNHTTRKVVQNEVAAARRGFLDGRTSVETVLQCLKDEHFVHAVKVSSNGSISGLFFTHAESARLARRYNQVFIMDCTYKTNRFGMPLLNIVGVTATFNTFNAGFAFLEAETLEYYVWALEQFSAVVQPKVVATDRELALMKALEIVFPESRNVLCIWHINKNVVSNTRKYFANAEEFNDFMKMWTACVYAKTAEEYESHLWALKEQSQFDGWEAATTYLCDVWLPLGAKFLAHRTNSVLHFGTTSTSS